MMSAVLDEAMARYARGDGAAFARVYHQLTPRLRRFLERRVGDDALVDDLVQLTFLQIHRARSLFLVGAPALPWAFAIARRLLIDARRREQREQRLFARATPKLEAIGRPALADELLFADEAGTRMRHALARLPERQRIAFEVLQVDGLSLADAAASLGTSVTAVKLRVHRAQAALRAAASLV